MASIDAVAAKFGEFKKEFDKPDANLDKCHALLGDLKVHIPSHPLQIAAHNRSQDRAAGD